MPLLDDETFARYGYRIDAIPPGSAKPILYQCNGPCSRILERQRRRVDAALLCHACAVTRKRPAEAVIKFKQTMRARYGVEHALQNPKILARMAAHNIEKWGVANPIMVPSVNDKRRGWWERKHGPLLPAPSKPALPIPPNLDRDATRLRYGYNVTDVSPGPAAFVLCRCSQCPKLFRKRRIDENKSTLCRDCRHRTWWATRERRSYALDPELSLVDSETKRLFGYRATSVSPGSPLSVVCRCSRCGDELTRARRNIVNPVICASCSKFLYWEKHHNELIAKRAETLTERYGETGVPSPNNHYGKTQKEISRLITSWGFHIIENKPIPGNLKHLDIHLPDRQVAFEYCGLRHHNELSKEPRLRDYHREKMDLAAAHGIRLYTIFEDEWIHRNAQTIGLLRTILSVDIQRTHARKCKVTMLDRNEAKAFIRRHHIQAVEQPPLIAWGLCLADEVLGVLTLRHDYHGRDGAIILNRLCFMVGHQVVGGATKLFAIARAWAKQQGYRVIITLSDSRWFDGGVYRQMGFQLARDGAPDYAYVKCSGPAEVRIPKSARKKTKIGCPAGVSEWVYNRELGYARIWDCGHKRWEFVL